MDLGTGVAIVMRHAGIADIADLHVGNDAACVCVHHAVPCRQHMLLANEGAAALDDLAAGREAEAIRAVLSRHDAAMLGSHSQTSNIRF